MALAKRQFAITVPQEKWINQEARRQGKSANEVMRSTLETFLSGIGNPHLAETNDHRTERESAV